MNRPKLALWACAAPQIRPATTTVLLVPGAFGGLHVFERRGSAAPRSGAVLTDQRQLREVLRRVGPTLVAVVLCGASHLDRVVNAAADLADVYVVPLHWLHSSRRDSRSMAMLAARLVTAHRRRPIGIVYRRRQIELPF